MEKPRAVVLFSGGMDSSVVLAMAADEGYEVHAITISYGQRHRVELDCAQKTAQAIGVKRHVFLNLDSTPFEGSALTCEDVKVPKGSRPPASIPFRPRTSLPETRSFSPSLSPTRSRRAPETYL